MDTLGKLHYVATQMDLEPAEEVGQLPRLTLPAAPATAPCGISLHAGKKQASLGVYAAQVSGGRPVRLLKTMLTTACERNCSYCPFRAGRNYRRINFKPEEMADAFMRLNAGRGVDGLFLSSGILKGGVTTQDKLLATADILRNRHRFGGYLHLKLMPGAERDQVERAMQLADRVSINLEAPTVEHLKFLAPMKQFMAELLQPLRWADEIRRTQSPTRTWNGRWASSVTQFVIGAGQDNDLDFLKATEYLYRKAGLRRTYFSAFHPVPDTPLEELPAEDPWREHRLYQASFLIRDYGWSVEEMPFGAEGRLPLGVDPKLAWAQHHLQHAPLELNRATRKELLRVPGIGPQSADRILQARLQGRIRSLAHLHQLGIHTERLADYVLLDGVQPARQLRLF